MKTESAWKTPVYLKVAVILLIIMVVTFSVFLYERKLLVSTIKDLPFTATLSRLLTEETGYTRNDLPLERVSDGALLAGSQTIPNRELFSATTIGLNPVSPESSNYATYLGTQNLLISEQILRLMSELNDGFYNQLLKQSDRIYDTVGDRFDARDDGDDRSVLTIAPGAELEVGFINATSTNATSTFAHSISIASDAQYRIGGVGVLSRQSNGAILGGDLSGNARGAYAIDIQSVRRNVSSVASGEFSVTFGTYNTVSGYNSIAVGVDNTASGGYSSAFGSYNIIGGFEASAFGLRNVVTANNAFAFGSDITNNVANSVMIGQSDSAKLTILDSGETQANFFTATALNATSTFAHSISIASDAQYRIGGVGVLSRQSNGAILGGDLSGNVRGLNAIDIQSIRSSATRVASGDFSTAFGFNNTATSNRSFAFGSYNTASGDSSVAFGSYNTASAYNASVFGSGITNNIANSVMIGPSDSAKLTILDSGRFGIGTTTPSAQLTTTGSVRFATFGAGDLQTDASGNLLVSSDERLKEIIDEYQATSSVQQLLGITPIQYRWKIDSGFDTSRIYTGFSAQNVAEFIPEAVGEDSQGFLTLSERPIIATIVNAIKEIWARLTQQQEQIDQLQRDNERLQQELEQLKEELAGSDEEHLDFTPTTNESISSEDNLEGPSEDVIAGEDTPESAVSVNTTLERTTEPDELRGDELPLEIQTPVE